MTRVARFVVLIGLCGAIGAPAVARAQRQPLAAQESPQAEGLPPREVQQLLDGYAVIQGQEFLGLNDTQFAQFLPKFKALLETRRRNDMERLRSLMNRMTNPRGNAQASENDLRERLRLLREAESRTANEIQKARDAVDQTLDLRQQARFRVFEEQIERRKLQLLMQVRQNRANRPGPRSPQ